MNLVRHLIWVFIGTCCAAQTVTTNPASVIQVFPSNSRPATATVSITGIGSVTINAATASGGNWLSVTPATGTLPLTATITMDPTGLPDGTYLGSVAANAGTIPVTILVGSPGPQLPPNGIVNAASYQGGAISPGEIVALFGTNIGPQIPYSAQVWDGVMMTRLAGTRVWIGNTPAPVIYAYPNQLAVVVPYEIAGQASVQVQVENLVARTPAFSVPVQSATPGFFTANSSGIGQLAALNQDGSVNSASNPADQGSVVSLYATGMGALNPTVPDGTIISSSTLPALASPVRVTIGGATAQVLYAGPAPGLVAGAIQINVMVPSGITGNVAAVATVGTLSSPGGCTISVR